jgi:hypothetical protein
MESSNIGEAIYPSTYGNVVESLPIASVSAKNKRINLIESDG